MLETASVIESAPGVYDEKLRNICELFDWMTKRFDAINDDYMGHMFNLLILVLDSYQKTHPKCNILNWGYQIFGYKHLTGYILDTQGIS